MLAVLTKSNLVHGKTVGVDATTLEANAAMRSIVRRDDGQAYQDYLVELAKESGIETPTREEQAKTDRKRPKKGTNKEWVHPGDPDAEITKMKDGSTHLAHKLETAVDRKTGAVLGVTLHGGAQGDTKTIDETLEDADNNLVDVHEQVDNKTSKHVRLRVEEVVADKGYHSNDVLTRLEESEIRTYIAEPRRGEGDGAGKVKRQRRKLSTQTDDA